MVGPAGTQPVDVLVVEDDPGDLLMITEAFDQAATPVRVHVARDGEEALRFLTRAAPTVVPPRPRLILLDLGLPNVAGTTVLATVKTDPDLLGIPVVVLSSSTIEADIRHCYELHANAYICKPLDFDGFTETIGAIAGCFLSLVRLPEWLPPRPR